MKVITSFRSKKDLKEIVKKKFLISFLLFYVKNYYNIIFCKLIDVLFVIVYNIVREFIYKLKFIYKY